ncbi:MAG: HepT-like ribonuclease domain-containing protein, partial [Roseiflexaceae bacterium]
MTGFNTIVRHLEQLQLYLDRLAELQRYSRETLLGDWHVQTMVERTLQLAIEAVISISEQIIASLSLPTPENSRAALGALADAGVLQRDLAIELQ